MRIAQPKIESRQHFPGLENLRAIAIVLVVALHCAVPYLVHAMPGLAWPTADARPSLAVDAIFWSIEGFIMPLFFLMSGFFAASSIEHYGPRQFLQQKGRRLLKPLVIAAAIILPLELYIWMSGWVIDGLMSIRKMRSLKLPPELSENLWGLSHLWYLQYLLLFCIGLAVWRSVRGQTQQSHHAPTSSLRVIGLPLLCAIPVSLILWSRPEIMIGFQHSFFPVPLKFLHSLCFFAAGLWLWSHRPHLTTLHTWSPVGLGIACLLIGPTLWYVHRETTGTAITEWERAGGAGVLGLLASTAAIGLFGWFVTQNQRPTASMRYLAKASFWIYLLHHPLAGLLHVAMMKLQWPGAAKFAVATVVNMTACLGTFLLIQRYQASRSMRTLKFPESQLDEARKAA